MKKFIIALMLTALSFAAYAQVPSVKVENAKGEVISTSEILKAGVPTVISFWSTACKPCIRELDAIFDALPDWQEEVKCQIVAVSTDDSRLLSKARSLAQGHGWNEDYFLLFDKNQDFMRAMNVSVVPHVFVIDANGKVVYSHTSYVPGNENDVLNALKKAAKK